MIGEDTLRMAQATVAELRQRGETERAAAIEAMIAALHEEPTGTHQGASSEERGALVGATGAMLKEWVRDGRYHSYRAGRFTLPKERVEEYVRRAGTSLDLEELSDEEAARLVAEDRGLA